MSGRTRHKAFKKWMELAAEQNEAENMLEYVTSYIAAGGTLQELSAECEAVHSFPCGQHFLRRILDEEYGRQNVGERLEQARGQAADVYADEVKSIADDVAEDKDAIAKAKLRTEARQFLAGAYNPRYARNQQAQVNVNVSIASLHLNELRARHVQAQVVKGDSDLLLTSGENDVIVESNVPVSQGERT